jgi:hypothetical protein
MNIQQLSVKARPYSGERTRLVKQYAREQNVSLSTAWRRYQQRDQLDARGNFVRKPRRDKGSTHAATRLKLAAAAQALRQHPTISMKEVADLTGIAVRFIRRANKEVHHPPAAKSAPGTVA